MRRLETQWRIFLIPTIEAFRLNNVGDVKSERSKMTLAA